MTLQLQPLAEAGVIAVLRAPSAQAAVGAAEALLDGGVTAIEITYSTPDAPRAIRELRDRRPETLVGAGTVCTPAQARDAADAGARFLVSPGSTPRIVAAMLDTGLPTLAGALTPTEVMAAVELGVHAIKLFPGSHGGPGYLRALRGPFPDLPVVPTGGVSAGNLTDWFGAGVLAVGAGGELCPSSAIERADWAEITDRARAFSAALKEARP
jgi:2-dehydro-3-deoxyphosphogluconate aldolase/(4S)-4-hydroxy-2-oxoglutarate aldolase